MKIDLTALPKPVLLTWDDILTNKSIYLGKPFLVHGFTTPAPCKKTPYIFAHVDADKFLFINLKLGSRLFSQPVSGHVYKYELMNLKVVQA